MRAVTDRGEAKRRALAAVPVTVEDRRMAARIDASIRQLDALRVQEVEIIGVHAKPGGTLRPVKRSADEVSDNRCLSAGSSPPVLHALLSPADSAFNNIEP